MHGQPHIRLTNANSMYTVSRGVFMLSVRIYGKLKKNDYFPTQH